MSKQRVFPGSLKTLKGIQALTQRPREEANVLSDKKLETRRSKMDTLELLRERTGGQIAAILSKVCGGDEEKLDALLRDELEVQLVKRELKLFDKNGRRIPPKVLQTVVCDPDKNFYLDRPKLSSVAEYANRIIRFEIAFGIRQKEEGLPLLEAEGFDEIVRRMIYEIESNKSLSALLNGVFLPIILPKVIESDYGEALENIFLPAVKIAYEKQFPNKVFIDHLGNNLAGKVSIVEGTRHDQLVKKMAQDYIIAIYFPNALQGFSVLASYEQMFHLPASLSLAGGFDTATAMAMYPDILARDLHTPGYSLSALRWRSPGYSLYFGAYDGLLRFGSRANLGFARDRYSSGLLFLKSV